MIGKQYSDFYLDNVKKEVDDEIERIVYAEMQKLWDEKGSRLWIMI